MPVWRFVLVSLNVFKVVVRAFDVDVRFRISVVDNATTITMCMDSQRKQARARRTASPAMRSMPA
eukprot:4261242-Lingulodinium_polyedra.AAC.1